MVKLAMQYLQHSNIFQGILSLFPGISMHYKHFQTFSGAASASLPFKHASPGGLSAKSYAGNNRQSDEQACRCLNTAYYKGQWDEVGLIIFAYLDALKLSPWNATQFYDDWEDGAFNVLVGYYMTLTNMMLQDEQFGSPFQHNSAQITIQNDLTTCANFIVRYFHHPSDVPFMPRKTIEWNMEPHFGECKKQVRGMPRFKDLINGRVD